tara:strand:+ start:3628 stop:3897 length:270 start_codon:yes stop_codon:yes gene_type:complete
MFLFKIFKKQKPVPLGRWALNSLNETQRKIDLANCDSCGSCGLKQYKKKTTIKVSETKLFENKISDKYLLCEDDIIDFGIYPCSFTLYK